MDFLQVTAVALPSVLCVVLVVMAGFGLDILSGERARAEREERRSATLRCIVENQAVALAEFRGLGDRFASIALATTPEERQAAVEALRQSQEAREGRPPGPTTSTSTTSTTSTTVPMTTTTTTALLPPVTLPDLLPIVSQHAEGC